MKHSCTVYTGHVSPTFLFHVIELQYKTKLASFRRHDRVILGMKSPKEENISKYTLFNSDIQFYNCQYMVFFGMAPTPCSTYREGGAVGGTEGKPVELFLYFIGFVQRVFSQQYIYPV